MKRVRKKAPRKKQRRKPQQRSAHERSRKRSRSPPPSHGEEDGEAESEEEGMFHEPNKPQRSAPRSRSRHSRSLHGKLPSSEQPATQGQIAVLQGQVTALLNDIQPGVAQQHMAPDGRMHAHAEPQVTAVRHLSSAARRAACFYSAASAAHVSDSTLYVPGPATACSSTLYVPGPATACFHDAVAAAASSFSVL